MAGRSVFEIVGPVMIGPSSSHTAGAVRIGRIARAILDEEPVKAEIILYGSFAKTFKGHGTDRALVAGLLGMTPDDSRLKNAFAIAGESGLAVEINTDNFQGFHPNTARINLTGISGKTVVVQGESVGGGNIIIRRINQYEVSAAGKNPTLFVEHADKPGVIGKVTTMLGSNGINIAEMRLSRSRKGVNNFVVIETDQPLTDKVLNDITVLPEVSSAVKIEVV